MQVMLGAMLLSVALVQVVESGRRLDDPFSRARCEAGGTPCLWAHRPGQCPSQAEAACLQECHQDADCPGPDKCCQAPCGSLCLHPEGLDTWPGLPPVPQDAWLRERDGFLGGTWSSCLGCQYVVEMRKAAGAMSWSDWEPAHHLPRARPRVRIHALPGWYYQIRVASVNSNGTRGWGEPSARARLSQDPQPPGPPQSIFFSRQTLANNSVSGVVSWDPPASTHLPVLGYEVTWTSPEGAWWTVSPGHATAVKIRGLAPHHQYSLQVRAYSQWGARRLEGTPGNLTLETGHYRPPADGAPPPLSMEISRPLLVHDKLVFRVSWKSRPLRSYALLWEGTDGCDKSSGRVVTGADHYDLADLTLGCRYTVTLRSKNSKRYGRRTFTTPQCHQFKPSLC